MTTWRDIRRAALERDESRCQVCSKLHSGQVHHILPRSAGGTDEMANLMTLCGRCHMLVSPVPDWLLTKVWQIPPAEVTAERQKIHDSIDQLVKSCNKWKGNLT